MKNDGGWAYDFMGGSFAYPSFVDFRLGWNRVEM